jgi:L-lactate dehydrogenase complex protein LldG
MTPAKAAILSRIRDAVGDQSAARASEYAAIPRLYARTGSDAKEASITLFEERLHDYEAIVYRCAQPDIARVVSQALTSRGKHRMVVPVELPKSWLPEGFTFLRDQALTFEDLDACQGVITGCAVAIALTGTIILRHTAAEGRRALTLIPDYHLCVVFENQIVDVVAEGIARMNNWASSPITTISGPSATADIEMTRVKGVHGPRFLDVILVSDE